MISAPYACAARASTWVKPPLPPLWKRPRAEVAVVLTHRVEQQHQAGALRHRADLGADDARRGQVALEDVALEVVVEEVGDAAGEQPDQVLDDLRLGTTQVAGELGEVCQVLRVDLPKMFGGRLSNSGLTSWQTRSMSYS